MCNCQFIANEMSALGWTVEEDAFEQNTVVGLRPFTNVIATLDANAPRRMVIACHFDSKQTPQGFLGATDSAVPCAQMINLAHTMKPELDELKRKGSDLTLQFIFFDGEEAFKQWSATDSLYGSRHLANKWANSGYVHNGVQGTELDRIDVFMLWDLLGARNPQITSSHKNTEPWFKRLVDIESALDQRGLTRAQGGPFFKLPSGFAALFGSSIDDDHKPFEKRGVPIIHVISSPFPSVWHTINDDASAIDRATVQKLNMIFRIFVSEYLELDE